MKLDDLAEEGPLSEIRFQFWKRYRTKHLVETIPLQTTHHRLLQRAGARKGAARQAKYGAADEHSGVGVKTDGSS